MQTPLFSVLICTVGKADLVRGAIASILSQGIEAVEVIVTDTSGTDAIRAVVGALRDERVRYYEVPQRDPTISWEYAYEQSTGRYVLWYDDDNRLVPGALARYAALIEQEGADVVSANHAYYFGEGNRHDPERSNVLQILLPQQGSVRAYQKEELLPVVYDFSMGTARAPARWHSAATFVSREICEQARREIGYVIAPHQLGNFTFHPVIFNYAKKAVYLDLPLCLIGKFSSSVTQQWSNINAVVERSRRTVARYAHTGLSQRTLGNTTAECYLTVRRALPAHERYPFNWEKLYRRYAQELMFITLPLGTRARAWAELWRAAARLSPGPRRALRRQVAGNAVRSLLLAIIKRLGLWEPIRPLFKKPLGGRRASLPLAPHGIRDIDACAQRLHGLLRQELGLSFGS